MSAALPVILIAAVVQGWTLYGLHLSIAASHWPATQPGWLLAFYAVAIFVPLTVQLLANHARRNGMWLIVLSMAALFLYFGWHHGARAMDWDTGNFVASGRWFPLAFVMSVLWLHMLPFGQCRLASGHWRTSYVALFDAAWRNTLVIAEAILFTTLFWLLLFLWQALFKMLGMGFFSTLFREPVFVYPVTALAFGLALHLIGSIERLTRVILEQLLNVLKWLALMAGMILALFTVALVFRLPGMIASGERAIGAAWLLWLVAVTVLFVNAAYRDGSVDQPYPRWIALALRCVVPLIVVIAATALYALHVRIDAHGFTVERVWASIAAVAAFIYAVGYAFAACRGGRWMAGIARVNVLTALFVIGAVGLALTPVLSPYRIAANSQFHRILAMPQATAGGVRSSDDATAASRLDGRGTPRDERAAPGTSPAFVMSAEQGTPFRYLRFNAGQYGMARLRELASLQAHPRAARIREIAAEALALQQPWQPVQPVPTPQRLAELVVHPAGRSPDAALLTLLQAELHGPDLPYRHDRDGSALGGIFVDLNADHEEEFVLVAGVSATLYERHRGSWRRIGIMRATNSLVEGDVVAGIGKGHIAVEAPEWHELTIGGQRYRLEAESLLPD